jgi:hypothetical protein
VERAVGSEPDAGLPEAIGLKRRFVLRAWPAITRTQMNQHFRATIAGRDTASLLYSQNCTLFRYACRLRLPASAR